MEAADLKTRILDLIEQRPHTSFVEITRYVPEARGEYEMGIPDLNVVLWQGLSREAIRALQELMGAEMIEMQPVERLVYCIDGHVLRLPLVRKAGWRYKSPKWLPVAFQLVDQQKGGCQ